MNTDRSYCKENEKIGEFNFNKHRQCYYCGGTLVKYDYDEGLDLFMCLECNASDIIDNGKRKFIKLY